MILTWKIFDCSSRTFDLAIEVSIVETEKVIKLWDIVQLGNYQKLNKHCEQQRSLSSQLFVVD